MSGSWALCKSAPRSRQTSGQHPTTRFLQAGCPSCRPTNSVKALKAITDRQTVTYRHKKGKVPQRSAQTHMPRNYKNKLLQYWQQKEHIAAATYRIRLRISNTCDKFPILYNGMLNPPPPIALSISQPHNLMHQTHLKHSVDTAR